MDRFFDSPANQLQLFSKTKVFSFAINTPFQILFILAPNFHQHVKWVVARTDALTNAETDVQMGESTE